MDGGIGRVVDDTEDVEAGDGARILDRLTLGVVEALAATVPAVLSVSAAGSEDAAGAATSAVGAPPSSRRHWRARVRVSAHWTLRCLGRLMTLKEECFLSDCTSAH